MPQLSIVLTLLMVFCPTWAFAHKVTVSAYVEDGTIYCESFFDDGRPVINGRVEVTTLDGVGVVKGQTDQNGLFHFDYSVTGGLAISVTTMLGHKDSIIFTNDHHQE